MKPRKSWKGKAWVNRADYATGLPITLFNYVAGSKYYMEVAYTIRPVRRKKGAK